MSNPKAKKEGKMKGFLKNLSEKLDKALIEKGKSQSCCGPSDKSKGKSSCCN